MVSHEFFLSRNKLKIIMYGYPDGPGQTTPSYSTTSVSRLQLESMVPRTLVKAVRQFGVHKAVRCSESRRRLSTETFIRNQGQWGTVVLRASIQFSLIPG